MCISVGTFIFLLKFYSTINKISHSSFKKKYFNFTITFYCKLKTLYFFQFVKKLF